MEINNISKLIQINRQRIVPVICDDMFYLTDDDQRISYKEFVAKYVAECIGSDEIIKILNEDFYYGMSFANRKISGLYEGLMDKLKNADIKLIPSVTRFLESIRPPIVVTTFLTKVIENALKGKEISCESKYYQCDGRNDLPLEMKDRTVVYHIFGGNDINNSVMDEDSMLSFLHSFHNEDTAAKALLNIINQPNGKRLLILGSTLPNWLFRFLFYPMYNTTGGYWLSLEKIESSLDFFLGKKEYNGVDDLINNTQESLDQIIERATPENVNDGESKNEDRKKIFFSYKRPEKDGDEYTKQGEKEKILIDRVKSILENDYSVWFDDQEVSQGGCPYWKEIKSNIQVCDLFVPIVTKRYMEAYNGAPVLVKLPEVTEIKGKEANDPDTIMNLSPVVREAYYAVKYNKKSCPIVIASDDGDKKFNSGYVENIAKNKEEGINLPEDIFSEKTMIDHFDWNPKRFENLF